MSNLSSSPIAEYVLQMLAEFRGCRLPGRERVNTYRQLILRSMRSNISTDLGLHIILQAIASAAQV